MYSPMADGVPVGVCDASPTVADAMTVCRATNVNVFFLVDDIREVKHWLFNTIMLGSILSEISGKGGALRSTRREKQAESRRSTRGHG